MSVQAGGEARSGIGTRLRAGRERKGLTVLQAAEKIHVDSKILDSLESEDFEALGAPVFVRGHLRRYAELVGEKPEELQSLYSNSVRIVAPDLTRVPKVEAANDSRRMAAPATVVLLVFAIAGGVWWVVTLSRGPKPLAPVPSVAVSPGPAAATATRSPVPASAPVSTARLGAEAAADSAQHGDPPPVGAAGAASGRGVVSARGTEATSAGPKETARLESPTASAPRVRAGVPAAGPGVPAAGPGVPAGAGAPVSVSAREAQLTLRFSSESWAEVYDSSGERLFYDIGSANSVRTFKGAPPLRVVLGNAPGVAVEVNGHMADLAGLTHPDGTAQFVVSRAGRLSRPGP
jgi:cytoskeleton protein RodZ